MLTTQRHRKPQDLQCKLSFFSYPGITRNCAGINDHAQQQLFYTFANWLQVFDRYKINKNSWRTRDYESARGALLGVKTANALYDIQTFEVVVWGTAGS